MKKTDLFNILSVVILVISSEYSIFVPSKYNIIIFKNQLSEWIMLLFTFPVLFAVIRLLFRYDYIVCKKYPNIKTSKFYSIIMLPSYLAFYAILIIVTSCFWIFL